MLLVAWEWVGSCCQHDIMSAIPHHRGAAASPASGSGHTRSSLTNATNRRQASSAKTARTRDNNTQPCVTEHRFLLPLTRTPKTPHYRISSHQIAPSSLDSGLPSTSPSLVARTGSDHEEERLCRREPLPRGLTCITGPRGGNQKGFRERVAQ